VRTDLVGIDHSRLPPLLKIIVLVVEKHIVNRVSILGPVVDVPLEDTNRVGGEGLVL
jgi:hypothetical protein